MPFTILVKMIAYNRDKSLVNVKSSFKSREGWSGGAMVLALVPVLGRPTNLDYSLARAYCACNMCGLALFGHFSLIYHFIFLPQLGRRPDID